MVIRPDSNIRLFWDLLILSFIIYNSLIIPYSIAFELPPDNYWTIIEFIIDISFFTDLFLNFNTAFYQQGVMIKGRKQIALNYFKKWFWLDLIATIPFTWITEGAVLEESKEGESSGVYKTPKIIRMFKIIRLLRMMKLIRIAKLKRIIMKIEDVISN